MKVLSSAKNQGRRVRTTIERLFPRFRTRMQHGSDSLSRINDSTWEASAFLIGKEQGKKEISGKRVSKETKHIISSSSCFRFLANLVLFLAIFKFFFFVHLKERVKTESGTRSGIPFFQTFRLIWFDFTSLEFPFFSLFWERAKVHGKGKDGKWVFKWPGISLFQVMTNLVEFYIFNFPPSPFRNKARVWLKGKNQKWGS